MKIFSRSFLRFGIFVFVFLTGAIAADRGVIVKSIAFPGMGQLSDGQTTKGLSIMAAEAVLISITFGQWATMSSAEYETKYRKIQFEKGGQFTDITNTYNKWQDAYDRSNQSRRNTIIFGGLSVGLWVANIFDAIVFQSVESPQEVTLLKRIKNDMRISATSNSVLLNYTIGF